MYLQVTLQRVSPRPPHAVHSTNFVLALLTFVCPASFSSSYQFLLLFQFLKIAHLITASIYLHNCPYNHGFRVKQIRDTLESRGENFERQDEAPGDIIWYIFSFHRRLSKGLNIFSCFLHFCFIRVSLVSVVT